MADPLITLATLALATQSDRATVEADEFAAWVAGDLSDYARFLGGHPDWDIESAPYDVRRAVLMAAKRTYKNPDAEVQTTVGPIGSRILEEEAVVNAFTEAETTMLQGYHPDPPLKPNQGTLWVQPTRTTDAPAERGERLYVADDQQVNLNTTNAAPAWEIPMFSPGDPGGDQSEG